MHKSERRHFSEETKLNAVRAALVGDKSFEQVAKEYDITANLLWYWRRKYSKKIKHIDNMTPGPLSEERGLVEASSSFPNDPHTAPEHEVNELLAQVQALHKENAALKELLRQYLNKDVG